MTVKQPAKASESLRKKMVWPDETRQSLWRSIVVAAPCCGLLLRAGTRWQGPEDMRLQLHKCLCMAGAEWTEGKRNHTDLSVPLRCSSVMVKIACEREEAAFIAVEPTVRAEFPSSRQPTISSAETTCLSVNPTICKTSRFQSNKRWHRGKDKKPDMSISSKTEDCIAVHLNMSVIHLNAVFGVFPNADGRFVFRCTQQVQDVFVIDLSSKEKCSTKAL